MSKKIDVKYVERLVHSFNEKHSNFLFFNQSQFGEDSCTSIGFVLDHKLICVCNSMSEVNLAYTVISKLVK